LATKRLELLREHAEELLSAIEAAQAQGMDASGSGTRLTNRMGIEIAVGRLFSIADLMAGAHDLQASEIQLSRCHYLTRVINAMPAAHASETAIDPEKP
jgi:hypothetical protein